MKRYSTAHSFRTALEDRINQRAKLTGMDVQRLRREVAFDRLLVRLFDTPSPPWALKGGYAMQLRINAARTTKDLDLSVQEGAGFSESENEFDEQLRDLIVQQAALPLDDHFMFLVIGPTAELNATPEAGLRFQIKARVADRDFASFHIDVGRGKFELATLDQLETHDLLAFAGIFPTKIPAISKEQQFAEKLHAYSLPRSRDRPNSRIKDLIDMILLIQQGMRTDQLETALRETFELRQTHRLTLDPMPPPEVWAPGFADLAIECRLNPDLHEGFQFLTAYLQKLFRSQGS